VLNFHCTCLSSLEKDSPRHKIEKRFWPYGVARHVGPCFWLAMRSCWFAAQISVRDSRVRGGPVGLESNQGKEEMPCCRRWWMMISASENGRGRHKHEHERPACINLVCWCRTCETGTRHGTFGHLRRVCRVARLLGSSVALLGATHVFVSLVHTEAWPKSLFSHGSGETPRSSVAGELGRVRRWKCILAPNCFDDNDTIVVFNRWIRCVQDLLKR
jgi:hypothetical protein